MKIKSIPFYQNDETVSFFMDVLMEKEEVITFLKLYAKASEEDKKVLYKLVSSIMNELEKKGL